MNVRKGKEQRLLRLAVMSNGSADSREISNKASQAAIPPQDEILQNAILNSAHFAIIATDANGVIQLFNVGAERLLGFSAVDVIDKMTPSDIHDPQEVIARARGLSTEFSTAITPGFGALAFKASRGIEDKYGLTYIRKDGSRFPAQVSITALRDRNEEIVGYLLIGQDDSAAQAAKIAAERERVADEMFRLAVEACPSGMVITDGAHRILLVNPKIEQQFGYRRDELIGRSIDLLVPAHLSHPNQSNSGNSAARPEQQPVRRDNDFNGLRKDGSQFPIEFGYNSITANDHTLALSVIVDISERRRVERLKEEFVATVSHELRTPLTSISGSLGLLAGKWSDQLPDSAARLLAIAHKNSQRLVRLVNDILDIEKIEAGRVVFRMSEVALLPLLRQAIEYNRGFADGYGVKIRLDTESVDGNVSADPDRLSQVITNLLSNAIKFSPESEEVLVAVAKRGHIFRISVRDHGPGIPNSFKPHVFEKFAQADATDTRQKGGTGLGLSIVMQIVHRLNGEVSFDDAVGGGAVFHVDLPAWDNSIATEIDLDSESNARRILICEGDRDAAFGLRERLRRAGFAVDFANTVNAAIARTDANHYAAVLVGMKLPYGNGIGILQVRARNKPADLDHLVQILSASIALEPQRRPRILHVDDDRDVLAAVSESLTALADVVSVDSIAGARHVLATDAIDLAVLDIAMGDESGLDLLPYLHDTRGRLTSVILFSAHSHSPRCEGQVHAALSKSSDTLKSLVATVRDHLALLPEPISPAAV
jgi:PAS domain S-box-containing protein